MKQLSIDVPDDLDKQLRAYADEKYTTIRSVVLQSINRFLKEEGRE